MSNATRLPLQIKEIEEHPDLQPGFYWTLDEGEESECSWAGPVESPEAAVKAAVEAIADSYAAIASNDLTGE